MRQALEGIRVVELGDGAASAVCGKAFADLGAEVVKVEPPGGGTLRAQGRVSAHYDTNKRSVVARSSSLADRAAVAALVARADLVIEVLGDGELADFGPDREEVRRLHPSLVVVVISGFGATGPYAGYRWSDLVVQTMSWTVYPVAISDQRPVRVPGRVALAAVGTTAAVGAVAAVLRARASGEGATIDCSAVEALAAVPSRTSRYLSWEHRGRTPAPPAATSTAGTLMPMGAFPCADGHVALMNTPQQLGQLLDTLDSDELRAAFARPDAWVRPDTKEVLDAALYPFLLSRTRQEVTDEAQAHGWPAAMVLSPVEVLEASHLHQRGFWEEVDDPVLGRLRIPGAHYRFAEGGWRLRRRAPEPGEHDAMVAAELAAAPAAEPVRPGRRDVARTDPSEAPLRGVRVLDLTTVWSGPYVTQLLADLGAEVIRVENPSAFPPTTKGLSPKPDATMVMGSLMVGLAPAVPGWPDRTFNRQALNNSSARNKLSCTLDPRIPEAKELFLQLAERSDVVVENLKASTFHRMGLQEGELLDRNPGLIVVRIPAAGLTGDWSGYAGFGGQFDGLSGFAHLIGHRGSDMSETAPTTYMDGATGPAGAFAILAALRYRAATGRGQVVELAQMENVLHQLGDVYVDVQAGWDPVKEGNRDRTHAPQGIYRCAGEHRWLAVSVDDDQGWASLAEAIDRPDLITDPRFATHAARVAHHDELDELVEAWTERQDVLVAFHALQAAGVAAGPLLDEPMAATDPQFAARGFLRPLASRDTGAMGHMGFAFQGLPQVWERGSPALGEDNVYVFKELLGLDDARYDDLARRHVITEDYLRPDGTPW